MEEARVECAGVRGGVAVAGAVDGFGALGVAGGTFF